MSLDTVLAEMAAKLPSPLALSYVDMTTGFILGVVTRDQYPMELLEEFGAMVGILLQGQHIIQAENMVDNLRGSKRPQGKHYFNEMILRTDHTIHVFLRGQKYPNNALVVVTQVDANIAMVLFRAHDALVAVENAIA